MAVEVIIQTGDMEFWADKSPKQWEAMKPLLKEQLEFVKEIVPEFKIASAVIHMDENSPHMHVIGVPVATGYKRGLSKQVAKTKVFDQERLEIIQDKMHEFVSKQMSAFVTLGSSSPLYVLPSARRMSGAFTFMLRNFSIPKGLPL